MSVVRKDYVVVWKNVSRMKLREGVVEEKKGNVAKLGGSKNWGVSPRAPALNNP